MRLSLVVLAGILFYESYQRLLHPQPVVVNTMMIVAGVALLLNLGIAGGARRSRRSSSRSECARGVAAHGWRRG